jgi:hypothetical protein
MIEVVPYFVFEIRDVSPLLVLYFDLLLQRQLLGLQIVEVLDLELVLQLELLAEQFMVVLGLAMLQQPSRQLIDRLSGVGSVYLVQPL